MTAAVFSISPEQVIIAMDTLAMAGDTGKPFFFTTKFYILPHLRGVMFATGIGDLASKWFSQLERYLARDIHHLDDFVTPALRGLGNELGLNEKLTTTVYHVGYSEQESRYVGFAYRSTDSFASERLEYGLRVKPPVEASHPQNFPDDFVAIMKRQKEIDDQKPMSQRVHIGGEIHMLLMQEGSMVVQTVHRFDEYDSLYLGMCEQLSS
jgi:hypothetical protein